MQPTASYFLCTSPRTLTFLLAEALEATGIAGKPGEDFDPDHERLWYDRLAITKDEDYLPKVLEFGTTPNGIFGAGGILVPVRASDDE